MSEFTRPLTVTQLPSGRWITDRQFTYCVGAEDSGDKIVVPKGSPSDFFSIPWGFRWLLPKSQKGNQAAVLHDYLCDNPDRSQKEIDLIFLEAMGVLDVANWKCNVMFQAARAYQWAKNPDEYARFRKPQL